MEQTNSGWTLLRAMIEQTNPFEGRTVYLRHYDADGNEVYTPFGIITRLETKENGILEIVVHPDLDEGCN